MARGPYVKRATIGALAIVSWYSITWHTHKSIDHPLHSIIFAFAIAGLGLLLAARLLPRDSSHAAGTRNKQFSPESSTIKDEALQKSQRQPYAGLFSKLPLISYRKRRHGRLLIIGCILLRVATLEQTVGERGCSRQNVEAIFLPLLVAIFNYFALKRSAMDPQEVETMWPSIFQEIYSSLTRARAHYLLPTALLSYGTYLLGMQRAGFTYICPTTGDRANTVLFAQFLGVFLDAIIILVMWRLLKDNEDNSEKLKFVGIICVCSAIALTVVGASLLLLGLGGTGWTTNLSLAYFWSAFKDGVFFALMLLCVIYMASEFPPLCLISFFVFTCVISNVLLGSWSSSATFPPQSKAAKSIGLFLVTVSSIGLWRIYSVSDVSKVSQKYARLIPTLLYAVLIIVFAVVEGLYIFRNPLIRSHPITSLIYEAGIEGQRWGVQASSSMSITTAINEYRRRHRGRAPPPNFDQWYAFAIARGCPVIDDYDQIYKDLHPFWALTPGEIRRRTLNQLPENDVALIVIQQGLAKVALDDELDKKWNLSETVAMINKFARWLPDMTVAISLTEWPQRAVPWTQVEQLSTKDFHGFLVDPESSTRRNREWLVPKFSRSKIPGHNEILIPGPRDFVNLDEPSPRAFVDVAQPRLNNKIFSEMEDVLFWRGPTYEGESLAREWRGMLQQRLVHLANNLTSIEQVPILLPSTKEEMFAYENVPATELVGLFRTDIGFTKFEHCSPRDCMEQEQEFGTRPEIPFEARWDYRYLFDVDGNGASEDFVAFLRSNSLPFRASIFRHWYDERLTPWLHYVPQNTRLHDVYSTLAYFAGLQGKLNGRDVDIPSNFRDAQFIADQGWKWAEKAIRREDAEAYMFRLLLEWGRLIDDHRNEIGLKVGR